MKLILYLGFFFLCATAILLALALIIAFIGEF